eukprot:scpid100018/ scgid12362/ 
MAAKGRIAIIIARVVALLSGTILMGIIAANGRVTDNFFDTQVCIYNQVDAACRYAEAVGALGLVFGVLLAFADFLILLEIEEERIKTFNLVSIIVAAFMAFASLVCFGVLEAEWAANSPRQERVVRELNDGAVSGQSAIALC